MKKYFLLTILFWAQFSLAQDCSKLNYISTQSGAHLNRLADECARRQRSSQEVSPEAAYWARQFEIAAQERQERYQILLEEVDDMVEEGKGASNIEQIRSELLKIYNTSGTSSPLRPEIRKTLRKLNKAFPPATAESAPKLGKQ